MKGNAFLLGGLIAVGLVFVACNKSGPAPESSASALVVSEIDEAKVTSLTGVPVKVLKTDSIGFQTINRFYWIRVQGRPNKAKLEEISKAVLDEVIAAKPKVYHSFTLHFISSEDIRPGAEMKRCFAKATFLPEGDWQKVGRDPIDGYGNYKLDCIIVGEQR
jgi:hypothetical protein